MSEAEGFIWEGGVMKTTGGYDASNYDRRHFTFVHKNKRIMWIDENGKIHVDPDAPADETAQQVCSALSLLAAR
jgi:hypothetical protein